MDSLELVLKSFSHIFSMWSSGSLSTDFQTVSCCETSREASITTVSSKFSWTVLLLTTLEVKTRAEVSKIVPFNVLFNNEKIHFESIQISFLVWPNHLYNYAGCFLSPDIFFVFVLSLAASSHRKTYPEQMKWRTW